MVFPFYGIEPLFDNASRRDPVDCPRLPGNRAFQFSGERLRAERARKPARFPAFMPIRQFLRAILTRAIIAPSRRGEGTPGETGFKGEENNA